MSLENVAIATDCKLRAPVAGTVAHRFNYDAHTKVKVGQPMRCCLIAFTPGTLRHAVILTFDLVTLICFALTLTR